MEFIEVSAKTVDDAITEASIKLGTTSDKIEVEAVSYTHLTLPTNSRV